MDTMTLSHLAQSKVTLGKKLPPTQMPLGSAISKMRKTSIPSLKNTYSWLRNPNSRVLMTNKNMRGLADSRIL